MASTESARLKWMSQRLESRADVSITLVPLPLLVHASQVQVASKGEKMLLNFLAMDRLESGDFPRGCY